MSQSIVHKAFAFFKRFSPMWAYKPIRGIGTAIVGPILAAHRTGYFRSSIRMSAQSRNGEPLPWYTYPSIDFLNHRNFDNKKVLEFGGGQSTLWWAGKAKRVITLEGDQQWYEKLKLKIPGNVDLNYVSMEDREKNISQVKDSLSAKKISKYDVIVIDGLYRFEMINIAVSYLADNGVIICDNAEGYGFYEGFEGSGLSRVDFFGNAPGVVLPHATSIYFRSNSFVFDATHPIPVIATESIS